MKTDWETDPARLRAKRAHGLAMLCAFLLASAAEAAIPVPAAPSTPNPARREPAPRAPQRQAPSPAPGVKGTWLLTMSVGSTAYKGMLDISDENGTSNSLIINDPNGSRVQQTCTVERAGRVEIQIVCRDPRFLVGSGAWNPDTFKVELRGNRIMSGTSVDTKGAFGMAEFIRP